MRAAAFHAAGDIRVADVPHTDFNPPDQAVVEGHIAGSADGGARVHQGPIVIPTTRNPCRGPAGPDSSATNSAAAWSSWPSR